MLEKEQVTSRYLMNILTKLKQFKDNDKLCDITINVHGKQFKAHKAILAAWSPKLATTLLSLNENRVNLTVNYKHEDAFSEVLEYLYSGTIAPDESNVKSLIDIGKNLMIDSLVNVCEDYLKTSTSLSNFVFRYFTSLKYGLTSLEQYVVTFVETNILFVIEQEPLLTLLPQDLKCFLTMGKMSQAKPEVRFTVIINWIGLNIGERDKYLLSLLKNMNWNNSVEDLLKQLSSMESIFTNNEFCLFQLLHSIVSATGHHLGPFNNTYPRLFSLYSHMVEDLLEQDKYLISSVEVNRVDPIPISAETVRTEKIPHDNCPEKKDAEVNTDVDSSYFSEEILSDITHKDFSENVVLENTADGKDVSTSSHHEESREKDILVKSDDQQNDNETKSVKQTEKHRRKNKPRKVSVKRESVTKTKKKKGRSKKPVKKQKVNIKVESKDEQVNIKMDDYEGETDNEYLENEKVVSDAVQTQQDDNLKTRFEVSVENVHTENETDKTCETRPGVRLRLKQIKSKYGSRVARKSKKSNTTRKMGSAIERRRRFCCTFEDCSFKSRTEHGLSKHIGYAHSLDVKLYCKKCDFSTSQMRLLSFHMKQHYPKSPYSCEEPGCSQKFFRMGLLLRHQMTHMEEKPYKCDQCSKAFGTYSQLGCHKKQHEGRQFECDVCLKRFTTKGAMQTHRAIHFDNKPYLCDTCGFATKHLSHLISHRKLHTGDVLRCTFPNCNYTTPKQGHMTQHVNTHLNIRNHICQVCGKSFVVRGKLLRHERIHLKEKLFKCKQCDYQTSRTDRMKLHIESHGIKFKKRKYNQPNMEDDGQQLDYHQMYERVQPAENESDTTTVNGFNINNVAIGEMKMDALTLAASASLIVDTFPTVRLDQIGSASMASYEEMQAAAFQNYEGGDVVLG